MNALLIVILAALSMLGALSIDAYLPAFPAIASQFSATNPAVQQSLTAYVFAFAIMTLFDRKALAQPDETGDEQGQ